MTDKNIKVGRGSHPPHNPKDEGKYHVRVSSKNTVGQNVGTVIAAGVGAVGSAIALGTMTENAEERVFNELQQKRGAVAFMSPEDIAQEKERKKAWQDVHDGRPLTPDDLPQILESYDAGKIKAAQNRQRARDLDRSMARSEHESGSAALLGAIAGGALAAAIARLAIAGVRCIRRKQKGYKYEGEEWVFSFSEKAPLEQIVVSDDGRRVKIDIREEREDRLPRIGAELRTLGDGINTNEEYTDRRDLLLDPSAGENGRPQAVIEALYRARETVTREQADYINNVLNELMLEHARRAQEASAVPAR